MGLVSFHESQLCPELTEGQPGILDLLNGEGKGGEGCWEPAAVATQTPPLPSLIHLLFRCLKAVMGAGPRSFARPTSAAPERPKDDFSVSHSAGKVGNAVAGVG